MSIDSAATVAAAPQQISSAVGGEAVILGLCDGVYYGLNSVGARVWELVQRPRSLAELRDELLAEFEVDAERCERDLVGLLEELRARGLVEIR